MSDGAPGPSAPQPPSPWAPPDQASPPIPQQPPTYGQAPYGPPTVSPPYGPPPAQPTGRPRLLPWVLGALAGAMVLVLAGGAFVVWSPWSGRSGPTTAPASPPAPAPPTDPGTAAPASPTSAGTASDVPIPTAQATGGPATRSWLSATNAYCRSTTDPALKSASAQTKDDPAAHFARAAAINRELDAVLRKNPPHDLRPQVEQITSHWDRMADLLDQAAAAMRRHDSSGVSQLLDQSDAANQLGNDLATRIGLPDCAQAGAIGVPKRPSGPGATV